MTPEAVIFDCDGVLVDSEPITNRVIAEEVTKLGWPLDLAGAIKAFKGNTMMGVCTLIEMRLDAPLPDKWLHALEQKIAAAFRLSLETVPGTAEFVRFLTSQSIPIAVASQGSVEKMRTSLGKTGLWDYFKGHVYSADMVPAPKPAPDLFLLAADKLGITPGNCMVVEDSPMGIHAAKAAGMMTVGLAPDGKGSDLIEAGADRIVHSANELTAFFQRKTLCQ
ncbi:HAD family hydrolase [Aestuariispira insulae]|uniref:HAD superfamily hydrolase (TIGR01509 family) n=1 Tax=Aestuariispira insulae TaxID=1461337 RepID=A0A3D9HN98_9PROT|nr:HAD family phosphatase [Aestuariispira insulae]RED50949.1 HAD superfamily hydrolase (TIGR01509 family) [Aestuariispira insulae]